MLRLARLPFIRSVVSWWFAHLSFVLPVPRLVESDRLIAFNHPRPSYPVHILIVPKEKLADLEALQSRDADLLVEVISTVHTLVERLALRRVGYRLIVNGGCYQEFPHLHFHLVSGEPKN